jgi:hypothetical protein
VADAVALAMLALIVLLSAGAAVIVVRAAIARRPERELPESERQRLKWERTGDLDALDAMKRAIEKEEGEG